jgi:hypothetical protein
MTILDGIFVLIAIWSAFGWISISPHLVEEEEYPTNKAKRIIFFILCGPIACGIFLVGHIGKIVKEWIWRE